MKKLRVFEESFKNGKTYQEAATAAGIPACSDLEEYWKLMEMDRALVEASSYFERLLEMAA